MIQFNILSGAKQGQQVVVKKFPWTIGRSGNVGLKLEEPGIWERHLEIACEHSNGLVVTLLPGAIAMLNGAPFQQSLLRNGDILELGSVRLQFWLSEATQAGLRWREWFNWSLFGLISGIQILLVYLLEQ